MIDVAVQLNKLSGSQVSEPVKHSVIDLVGRRLVEVDLRPFGQRIPMREFHPRGCTGLVAAGQLRPCRRLDAQVLVETNEEPTDYRGQPIRLGFAVKRCRFSKIIDIIVQKQMVTLQPACIGPGDRPGIPEDREQLPIFLRRACEDNLVEVTEEGGDIGGSGSFCEQVFQEYLRTAYGLPKQLNVFVRQRHALARRRCILSPHGCPSFRVLPGFRPDALAGVAALL